MSVVRHNLMNREGYTPYCGNDVCHFRWPRTTFKDNQFHCRCGWVSQFENQFIAAYKQKWNLEKVGEAQ